ncbi:6227_t:CDS:2 [Ambispora gerdemannii]|uniref:6227_t:CDS:1 n=1 Tax=Ambispora gerdemannii TaxID=144530 RepID=A0A9N9BZ58_9GLOM|nr:6227_t:CDS:2 [Ambispora gerdemannii]
MAHNTPIHEFSRHSSKHNSGSLHAITKNSASSTCLNISHCFFMNNLLIWARKQRGPYYDPTTRMYQVDFNSKRYFSGYSLEDAEAENNIAATSGQKNLHTKPTIVNVDKEIVNVNGHHNHNNHQPNHQNQQHNILSAPSVRIISSSGRRPENLK